MQLHLEVDELNLLANLLMERIGTISTQASSDSGSKADTTARRTTRQYNDLLDKVLAHDLRFDCDELEQVADFLAAEKRELKNVVVREPNSALKAELQGKLSLLDHVWERVDEACVMI